MKIVLTSWIVLFLLCVLPVIAEEAVSEDTLPETDALTPAEAEYYSVAGKWNVHVGGGLSVSLLQLDFDKQGMFSGESATVNSDSSRSEEHFAATLGLKYAPVDVFAVGISLDYNILPLDQLNMKASTVSFPNIESKASFGLIHNLSGFLFAEFRLPIKIRSGMIIPYVQAGLGTSYHIPDFSEKELRLRDKVTMAVYGGAGLEVFPQEIRSFSFFAEAKWHYSFGDFIYKPIDNSKFSGSIDFMDISLLIGVNLYLN
jgi:hypothetical protein